MDTINSIGDVSIERLPGNADHYIMRLHDSPGGGYGDPFFAVCVMVHDHENKTVILKAGIGNGDNNFSPRRAPSVLQWIWKNLCPDRIVWERMTGNGMRKVVVRRKADAAD